MIKVKNLKKYFPIKGGFLNKKLGDVKAVENINFEIPEGEILGLVGESGCGKSTLAKTLLQLEDTTSGNISFEDKNINDINSKYYRSSVQMIFQDPYNSLNPRKLL